MKFEELLFRQINSLAGHFPAIDFTMAALSDSMTWIFTAVVLLIVAVRTANKNLLSLIFAALIALSCSDLISFEIIKPIVARERPCWLLHNVILAQGKCGGSYGFTSNHASNAFAVWAIISKMQGLRSWQAQIALTLATLVSISRVYLGVHFVGDVVGGAILGTTVAWSLWALGIFRLTEWLSQKIFRSLYSAG